MHVHSSTQHPTEVQRLVAHCLGLKDKDVLVTCRRMGGGFGGKETQPALFACIAALAAHRTGRPVKLRVDRDADMLITGKRHPFDVSYDVGFDDDGRILGVRLTMSSNCGRSADLSDAVNDARDVPRRQLLLAAGRRDRLASLQDEPAFAHGLPRLRRPAGHAADRGRDRRTSRAAWARTRSRCAAPTSTARRRATSRPTA